MANSAFAYRRALTGRLDDGGVYDASSGGVNTVQIPSLVNADPLASPDRYNGAWVYISSGTGIGQQAVVRDGGYAPSTGTLTSDPQWTAPALSSVIQITRLFPSISAVLGEDESYFWLLNRALARLLVPDRVSLTITTSDGYSLASWPWLDRPERLTGVFEPSPVSGRRAVPAAWRAPRLVLDGETPRLEVAAPFSSAVGSLILEVLRPANTWIRTGGTWTETAPSNGLSSDSDEAIPSVGDVITVALMFAYQSLASRSPGMPSGDWSKKYLAQRDIARKLRYFDRTAERDESPAAAPEQAA